MQPYSLSSNDFVEVTEETVKHSEETNQEYDQEKEEEDGRCNRTRKMAGLRKDMVEGNAEDALREGEDTAKTVEPCGGRKNREDGEIEEEELDEDEDEDEEEDESSHTSSLGELNLLIVVLSLFSASTEESLNVEERIKVPRRTNREEEVSASKLQQQPRVRKMDELKVASRQTPPPVRFQTTIKDSRHGRRF